MKITTYGRGPVVSPNTRFTGTARNGARGLMNAMNVTVVTPDSARPLKNKSSKTESKG